MLPIGSVDVVIGRRTGFHETFVGEGGDGVLIGAVGLALALLPSRLVTPEGDARPLAAAPVAPAQAGRRRDPVYPPPAGLVHPSGAARARGPTRLGIHCPSGRPPRRPRRRAGPHRSRSRSGPPHARPSRTAHVCSSTDGPATPAPAPPPSPAPAPAAEPAATPTLTQTPQPAPTPPPSRADQGPPPPPTTTTVTETTPSPPDNHNHDHGHGGDDHGHGHGHGR